MWHIHVEYENKNWVLRKNGGQLKLYSGSYLGAIWRSLSLVKVGEKICVHRKNGSIRKIL